MPYTININPPLPNDAVPSLREKVGWGRRDQDFPALFNRCNFYAAAIDQSGKLIGFGYVCGMGLEHGYMEDIIVDPTYQGQEIGTALVKALLHEGERFGLEIITVSYMPKHTSFYQKCGFSPSGGGVWQKNS